MIDVVAGDSDAVMLAGERKPVSRFQIAGYPATLSQDASSTSRSLTFCAVCP